MDNSKQVPAIKPLLSIFPSFEDFFILLSFLRQFYMTGSLPTNDENPP
jgi:hypothetical protein